MLLFYEYHILLVKSSNENDKASWTCLSQKRHVISTTKIRLIMFSTGYRRQSHFIYWYCLLITIVLFSESVRSPKERCKEVERERNNHERNDSQADKRNRSSGINFNVSRSSKYDKKSTAAVSMPPGSEWSEHISSLGKRYYYNCITEVSQWEKPRDLDSRRTASKDSTYTSRSSKYQTFLSRSASTQWVIDLCQSDLNILQRHPSALYAISQVSASIT